ncbi:uncharacterized protein LOC132281970 [Cornus florida]|uniref:uncharacterized protein LOC132281970 n=1 Tax=Cornus florida TaxID=4283 RepID=UPI00289DCDE2|nr:uncharacterized protein LOC132281970 [Cornus florida]
MGKTQLFGGIIGLLGVLYVQANLPAPASSSRDTKKWIPFPTGLYSFSHTVSHLVGDLPTVPWHNLVWNSPSIPRMKFILWSAVQSKLPTLDSKSMSKHINICPLCSESMESHDHIFLNCSFVSPLWRFIKYKCSMFTALRSWEALVRWASAKWKAKNSGNLLRKLGLLVLVYHTWEERNARIFRGKKASQRAVCAKICSTIFAILKLGCFRDCASSRSILKDWNISPSCCRSPLRPPD